MKENSRGGKLLRYPEPGPGKWSQGERGRGGEGGEGRGGRGGEMRRGNDEGRVTEEEYSEIHIGE